MNSVTHSHKSTISCILMNIWFLSTLFLSSCYATRDAQYECGPHGRFEYCIDGIPGCVIGCHCHPGYYFDTDSKICEPNINLRQDYRRHYLSEPTRIQVPSVTNDLTSTTNPVDHKIDEITKDAGDLGDWLYNQFFKAIQNQVINNTDENEPMLTRRSGSVPITKKPKRKNHKYLKKTNKKKKNNKSGLKKKLLRITDDDSLFDSSSTSSSDETSSISTDSDSDTSSESERNHGHKKLLVYNKKPKPPLPSFIFLPNMDTPFYPPIGLLPPSALPMYPMVPVPPMGPMFPYPSGTAPNSENCNETSTNKATTGNSNLSMLPTKSQLNIASMTTNEKFIETETTTMLPFERPRLSTEIPSEQDSQLAEGSVARSKHLEQLGAISNNKKWLKAKPNRGHQIKLLQAIKQKLKRKNKVVPLGPSINAQNDSEQLLGSNYFQNLAKSLKKQTENFEDNTPMEYDTPMEDVDFKYITELIHRVNQTKRAPNLHNNDVYVGIPKPLTNRRNYYYNSQNIPDSNIVAPIADNMLMRRPQESDDSYYTNLGRQIASMIRNVDTQGQRQLNIGIERSKTSITTSQPFFEDNIYASRSYWDRLVRSTETKYFPLKLKEAGYFKDSNENLIDVENKAKHVLGTFLPLTLSELENIINEMKHANDGNGYKNVLTQVTPTENYRYKLFQTPINTQKSDNTIINNTSNITKTHENLKRNNKIRNKLYSQLLSNLINIALSGDDRLTRKVNNPKTLVTPTRRFLDNSVLKNPLFNDIQLLQTVHKIPVNPRTKNLDKVFQVKPMRFNLKKNNYYSGNNDQYPHQKSMYPIYFQGNTRKVQQTLDKSIKPSYFHHELHHFDYFDK